jgi:histidyl-tRNA synthetase
MTAAFELLDRRDKLPNDVFAERAAALGLTTEALAGFDALAKTSAPITTPLAEIADRAGIDPKVLAPMEAYGAALIEAGLDAFCDWDLGIVRGLAYYTGGVFEIRDASGTERAIAGGGRYDGLVELFGGQPTSAVGFGMGDVVLGLLLEEKGLLAEAAPPEPSVFLVSTSEAWEGLLRSTMHGLRRMGLHAQRSYRATRNLGKLLGEAGKRGASMVLIFDESCETGVVHIKDLESGEQTEVALADLETYLFEHDELC